MNQEDVKALGESEGDLTDQFECAFYAEKKRKNRIKGNNIVNMGVQVYGQVSYIFRFLDFLVISFFSCC